MFPGMLKSDERSRDIIVVVVAMVTRQVRETVRQHCWEMSFIQVY